MRPAAGSAAAARGTSVVEVVMVAILLSVCILPFLSFFRTSTRGTAHLQSRSLGLSLADHTMERYRSAGYDFLKETFEPNGGGSEAVVESDRLLRRDSFPEELRKRMERDSYKRRVMFREVPPPEGAAPGAAVAFNPDRPRLGILKVVVSWKEPTLPAASVVLSKVVLDYSAQ
jgi:hypothetical protein